MNNYKLIYIVFLFPICLFAQIKPTKSSIQKIVKNSIVEMKKGKFSLPSNKSWEFNNIDSLVDKLLSEADKFDDYEDVVCDGFNINKRNKFLVIIFIGNKKIN